MKLKINKTSTKRPRLKMRIQKNRDWSWNTNNQEGKTMIFGERERKQGGKKYHQQQTEPSPDTRIEPTWRGYYNASKDMTKGYFWRPKGTTHADRREQMPLIHPKVCHTRTSFSLLNLDKYKNTPKLTF